MYLAYSLSIKGSKKKKGMNECMSKPGKGRSIRRPPISFEDEGVKELNQGGSREQRAMERKGIIHTLPELDT